MDSATTIPQIDDLAIKIAESLSLSKDKSTDIMLVNKPTLVGFLKKLPRETLLSLVGFQVPPQPLIDTTEWVDWFIATRQILNISREDILTKTLIDKGDLSNFESKSKHFGVKRRRKLLAALSL